MEKEVGKFLLRQHRLNLEAPEEGKFAKTGPVQSSCFCRKYDSVQYTLLCFVSTLGDVAQRFDVALCNVA